MALTLRDYNDAETAAKEAYSSHPMQNFNGYERREKEVKHD